MKIKFNWGTGIVIFLILFFISIGYRIYLSTLHPVDLVSEDYYPKEIAHQTQIDKEKNTTTLNEKIIIEDTPDTITVTFPKEIIGKDVSGFIYFYRPSNSELDKRFDIVLNENLEMKFPASDFEAGKYILQIDWSMDGTPYYQKKELFFGDGR